jgi:hypothetical protein
MVYPENYDKLQYVYCEKGVQRAIYDIAQMWKEIWQT